MKIISVIIFSLISLSGFSQKIDYCTYFKLDVAEYVMDDGTKKVASMPLILSGSTDEFSKFLKGHSSRFQYILFQEIFKFSEIQTLYPDTNRINDTFCAALSNDSTLRKLSDLSPGKLTSWSAERDTFTVDELMLAASRFFYCSDVNKEDTSVVAHICVGINGQSELKSDRDLLLLEAFAFEAIFYHLSKKKTPEFDIHFSEYIKTASKKYRASFTDFDSYLVNVRNECYRQMKNDSQLKKKLLEYYRNNRSNFNLAIVNTTD
jgi:hypothetical protein